MDARLLARRHRAAAADARLLGLLGRARASKPNWSPGLAAKRSQLDVPMRVDLKFGRSWGDAKHSWEELHRTASSEAVKDVSNSPTSVIAADVDDEEDEEDAEEIEHVENVEDDENDIAQPVTQRDIDEINAGLARWGIEPINGGSHAGHVVENPGRRVDPDEGRFGIPEPKAAVGEAPESPADDPTDQGPKLNGQGADAAGVYAGQSHGSDGPADDHRDSAGDPTPRGRGQIDTIYPYPNEKGENHHRKIRTTTKKFWQEIWNGKGWSKGGPDVRYLYNVCALIAARPDQAVAIAEGEKDADTLTALGFPAVTNPGGAGKWNSDFTQEQIERWFKGRLLIYLFEDNDKNGRKHVNIIAKALFGLVGEIRIVSFRELKEKADVTDWIESGHTKDELIARAEAAPKWKPDALDTVSAADVEMRELTWVWPDRFAVGKVGLLVGLPDEGKGQILFYIAAQITNGGEWPCDEGAAPKGSVILLTAEDDLHDTVVPRLAAAGADRSNVHIIKMVKTSADKGERMFSLVEDLELLRRKIIEIGDVVMVQIDPMSAYLGVKKIDSFRATDVRAVLAPLVQLASELKLAVLGILHFNKKLDVTNALLRISDSLAFGATARHVYACIDDDEHGRKLLVKGKNNLARRSKRRWPTPSPRKRSARTPSAATLYWQPTSSGNPNTLT